MSIHGRWGSMLLVSLTLLANPATAASGKRHGKKTPAQTTQSKGPDPTKSPAATTEPPEATPYPPQLKNPTKTTCYFNATMQCLMQLKAFNAAVAPLETRLATGYKKLLSAALSKKPDLPYKDFWEDAAQISFVEIYNKAGYPLQQDAAELFVNFVNRINLLDELNPFLFSFEAGTPERPKEEYDIQLGLPVRLESSLITSLVELPSEQWPRLRTFPQCFMIQLLRFTPDNEKLSHSVSFPISFQFSDFGAAEKTALEPIYALSGVVQHQGKGPNSGHYTAYVHHGDQWFFCDDTKITKKSLQAIEQLAEAGKVGDFDPYLLFYQAVGDAKLRGMVESPAQQQPRKEMTIICFRHPSEPYLFLVDQNVLQAEQDKLFMSLIDLPSIILKLRTEMNLSFAELPLDYPQADGKKISLQKTLTQGVRLLTERAKEMGGLAITWKLIELKKEALPKTMREFMSGLKETIGPDQISPDATDEAVLDLLKIRLSTLFAIDFWGYA